MSKTVLITGSTDGIGLATAMMLADAGHKILLHGRSAQKLKGAVASIESLSLDTPPESYLADLSSLREVSNLADAVSAKHSHLDVLINNAGIYRAVPSDDPLDSRFVVNTIAPFLLTTRLLPLLGRESRVINLSSAAQSSVDLNALQGNKQLDDGMAYAQSKLALTMWSIQMAEQRGTAGPIILAVNPASMLGSKMVKEAYGVSGGDLRIGANILVRAALSPEFANATGKYFDNDQEAFASPHPDALDAGKRDQVIKVIAQIALEQINLS